MATWLPCMARGSTWEYHLIMALHNISGKTKAQFSEFGGRDKKRSVNRCADEEVLPSPADKQALDEWRCSVEIENECNCETW